MYKITNNKPTTNLEEHTYYALNCKSQLYSDNMYSFALDPEYSKPSGGYNFGRLTLFCTDKLFINSYNLDAVIPECTTDDIDITGIIIYI